MPDFELRDLKENHGHTLTKMPIKCLYTLTIATITTIFIIQSSLQTVPNFIGEYFNIRMIEHYENDIERSEKSWSVLYAKQGSVEQNRASG